MNILHYALGFPPYRSGGLTKFCMDLMEQQSKERHTVSLLWPGEIAVFSKGTAIRNHGSRGNIGSFEVINPAPVSYDEGIMEMEPFVKEGNEEVYEVFLRGLAPEVLHVHTFMGIHKSLLVAARRLGIRIVFSAHDFFPICPKVTMFRMGEICGSIENCSQCAACNTTALSLKRITLLQSGLYRMLKDSSIVRALRKRHRDQFLGNTAMQNDENLKTNKNPADYIELRKYYKSLLEFADVIHYNSSVTQSVYEAYMTPCGPKAVRIPITHGSVQDNVKEKAFDGNLRITYLGPAGDGKGFFLLRKALDQLWNERENGRQDFSLNIFFRPAEPAGYMNVHERYTYDQLEGIFENTDVLIAPSIWYETFGYTVLEALSFGVPVIISGTVGAKDIIPQGAGVILQDITAEILADTIKELSPERLKSMNTVLLREFKVPTLASMSMDILRHCYQ